MPQLGATFVPGGLDDYYMPEVVAPSPQRYSQLFLLLSPILNCIFFFFLLDVFF
jgi:hypothetical protein